MDSINNNPLRVGRFTSSQMHRLCEGGTNSTWKVYKDRQTFEEGKRSSKNFDNKPEAVRFVKDKPGYFLYEDKPALPQKFHTYVKEVFIERTLKRSAKTEYKNRAMAWGKLMELILFDLIGTEYQMKSKSTIVHPGKYKEYWSGTPDLKVEGVKAGEIKAYEPLHFGKLALCLRRKSVDLLKEEEPDVYWQVVSNAMLLGYDRAEIMVYMPYKKEVEFIIKECDDTNFLERNGLEPNEYYFLRDENIDQMAWLPEDSKFKNLESFEFEIPAEDKAHLIERLEEAIKELKELEKCL